MVRLIPLIFFIFLTGFASAQKEFLPSQAYLEKASKAFEFYQAKNYSASAKAYDSLFIFSKGKGQAVDKYNAACSWALAGNKDKAFNYLNKTIKEDRFSELAHMLSDSDLDALHTDKRWTDLINHVKANKEKAEANLNKPLAAMLDSVYTTDQEHRQSMMAFQEKYGWNSKEMDSLIKLVGYHDSINLVKVKNLIDSYGWLGPEEVGKTGASAMFLVIQHADSLTQVTYVPQLREAVKKGKARAQDLAYLEDRILTNQGKPQIYGSQVRWDEQTGKYEFFAIADEANVNKRRASVGLEPLESYAKNFQINYTLPKGRN